MVEPVDQLAQLRSQVALKVQKEFTSKSDIDLAKTTKLFSTADRVLSDLCRKHINQASIS